MTASAVWPLAKAMAAAIQGDAALVTGGSPLLHTAKPVHNGKAPPGSALDYIVLADGTEAPWLHMNGQGGNEGGETLNIWTADLSRKKGQLIYAELRRLFDGTLLSLDGHTMVRGRLSLLTSFVDDTAQPAARATVVTYAVLSKAA